MDRGCFVCLLELSHKRLSGGILIAFMDGPSRIDCKNGMIRQKIVLCALPEVCESAKNSQHLKKHQKKSTRKSQLNTKESFTPSPSWKGLLKKHKNGYQENHSHHSLRASWYYQTLHYTEAQIRKRKYWKLKRKIRRKYFFLKLMDNIIRLIY